MQDVGVRTSDSQFIHFKMVQFKLLNY